MAGTPNWRGYTDGTLIETPRSGAFKMAERITFVQEFEGKYGDAFIYTNAHPRGSLWYISIASGNISNAVFYVEDSALVTDPKTGSKATVTVNYVYLASVPPDEWSLTPFEVNPPIERHSYFSALTQADLKKARTSYNSATAAGQTSIDAAIAGTSNATLCQALVNKWLRGEETFYLAGFKCQHTMYYGTVPTGISKGGFIQTPFGTFSGNVPSGLAWLRQADELVWNNGLWKLTQVWVGAPSGWWDSDLYS